MNVYLVINNKAENRFVVCAENTERAYELARENGRENEVFDRSFFSQHHTKIKRAYKK